MARLQEALDEEVKKGRDLEFLLEEAKMEAEGWERETRALRKRVDEAEVQSGDKVMNLISQVDDMHAKVIIDNFGVDVCTIRESCVSVPGRDPLRISAHCVPNSQSDADPSDSHPRYCLEILNPKP